MCFYNHAKRYKIKHEKDKSSEEVVKASVDSSGQRVEDKRDKQTAGYA